MYKIGQLIQYGIDYEKNLKNAIRKFEDAAAHNHVLSMNALGSLYFNEKQDFP